ncbi:hypothetical protein V8B97DRAFT_1919825 [Scleroderma yunnanense]
MVTPAGISAGPILAGFTLNTILYGVVICQTFAYFWHYKSDARWIKLFVAQLFTLDTVNVVFEFLYLYDALIKKSGDESTLHESNWLPVTTVSASATMAIAFTNTAQGLTSASVQLFLAWRIYILSSSVFLVVGIGLMAVTSTLCAIATSVAVNAIPTFSEFFRKFVSIVIVWLSASAADNLLITITLVRLLRDHRTGFADTDHIIEKIIRVTLQTGLLTALWTIIDLSVYLALTNGTHLIFTLPLAKLYTISLLSTLTSRLREEDYLDFTVVNGSAQRDRREEPMELSNRQENTTRNSEIVFDSVSVKKAGD